MELTPSTVTQLRPANQARALTSNEYAAVASVGALVGVLGVIGFANSFAAVTTAAQPSFGRMAWSVPLGIDLGIGVFAALDIVLARLDMRLRWLRLVPWTLTGATVYLNVAGEHTQFGRVAHAVLPALWVVAVEVGAHVIRVRAGIQAGTRMDRIRTSRWVLAPFRTAALWRRMVLWEIRSYGAALDRERTRLLALTDLQDAHGPISWRWKASRRTRALYRLGELAPTGQSPAITPVTEPVTEPAKQQNKPEPKRPPRRPAKKRNTAVRQAAREADALALLTAHPEMTGSELGRRLKVSDRTGRRLHARATALIAANQLIEVEGATA